VWDSDRAERRRSRSLKVLIVVNLPTSFSKELDGLFEMEPDCLVGEDKLVDGELPTYHLDFLGELGLEALEDVKKRTIEDFDNLLI
jgi:hypothetical protein